jgi:hypothetical protein
MTEIFFLYFLYRHISSYVGDKMAMKTALLAAGLLLGSAQAITVEYVELDQAIEAN